MSLSRNENIDYNFGERITHLMQLKGIDIASKKKPGPDRILAKIFFDEKILSFGTDDWIGDEKRKNDCETRQLDSAKTIIQNHRKTASATKVSGEWINRYCQIFDCDSDYLFGYTDTPSREVTDISKSLGLSETSVKLFTDFQKRKEKLDKWLQDYPKLEDYSTVEDFKKASVEHEQKRIMIEEKYEHVPYHLIQCLEALLNSCNNGIAPDNIIDLIYRYLSSISRETVDIMYSYERKGQIIEQEYYGRIYPHKYDHTYLTVNEDPLNRLKLSEIVGEAQLRSIYDKLSQIKEDLIKKEE